MLLPSASLFFNNSSFSLMECPLPDLIGLALCVSTFLLALVLVRIKVSAFVLLLVSSFFFWHWPFWIFRHLFVAIVMVVIVTLLVAFWWFGRQRTGTSWHILWLCHGQGNFFGGRRQFKSICLDVIVVVIVVIAIIVLFVLFFACSVCQLEFYVVAAWYNIREWKLNREKRFSIFQRFNGRLWKIQYLGINTFVALMNMKNQRILVLRKPSIFWILL